MFNFFSLGIWEFLQKTICTGDLGFLYSTNIYWVHSNYSWALNKINVKHQSQEIITKTNVKLNVRKCIDFKSKFNKNEHKAQLINTLFLKGIKSKAS